MKEKTMDLSFLSQPSPFWLFGIPFLGILCWGRWAPVLVIGLLLFGLLCSFGDFRGAVVVALILGWIVGLISLLVWPASLR
jgi:hypothetical protein